jgi:hypothetical protein
VCAADMGGKQAHGPLRSAGLCYPVPLPAPARRLASPRDYERAGRSCRGPSRGAGWSFPGGWLCAGKLLLLAVCGQALLSFVTNYSEGVADGVRLHAQLPCEEHQAKGEASGEYCRMDVTLGGYVLRPVDGGRKTEFHVLSMPLAPQLALSLAVREVGPFD